MRTILFLFAAFAVCFGNIPKPTHPNEEYPKSDIGLLPGNSRIIGGSNANEGQNPWQASLMNGNSHSCGASIIGRRWLLCAAHCTQGKTDNYRVLINTISRTNEDDKGKYLTVTNIINHPNYGSGSGSFPNDISLIEVDQDMVTNSSVNLAPEGSEKEDFSDCRITGWGRTCGFCGLPNILQTANVNVLTDGQCTGYWGASINSGHVCVTENNKGACNGDSGGPLVCRYKGSEHILVGATSFGLSGCSTSRPSVYSYVPYFHEWITGHITE